MGLTLPTATRNALANQIATLIDAGAGSGYVEIYTAAFALLLSTNVFSDPSFGGAVVGVITANPIANGTAVASGTATTFKIFDSNAVLVCSGTVGTAGADIIFAGGNVFTAGQIIRLTSFTFTMPAS